MTKHPDWRERLHEFLKSRRKAAFSWATNNGAVFSAGAIAAMTGEDLYPPDFLDLADPVDVSLEQRERNLLAELLHQRHEANQELARRMATANSAAAAYDHTLRDEADTSVLDQRAALKQMSAAIDQQIAAVAIAAQKVAKPILAAAAEQGGIEAMVTARMGEPLPGVLLANYGDVVMAAISDGTLCIGICLGAHCAFVSDQGLSKIRLGRCLKAWKVG